MKITNFKLITLIGVLLTGLLILLLLHGDDRDPSSRLSHRDQIWVPDRYVAASLSEGTILLLLAVGVIGALGISRIKKGIGSPAQRKATDSASGDENVNEDRQKRIAKNP
jgi:hypothetical protein